MCGKDKCVGSSPHENAGSPPRVREGHNVFIATNHTVRITPACAGRTVVVEDAAVVVGDHPRVCGKDYAGANLLVVRKRITPACAGRTLCRLLTTRWSWDHPRVCGKDFFHFSIFSLMSGSPPRVREGLHQHAERHKSRGITPACAGRTARCQ